MIKIGLQIARVVLRHEYGILSVEPILLPETEGVTGLRDVCFQAVDN